MPIYRPTLTAAADPVSPLTLNRLSVYLRCLRELEREGVSKVSSRQLAERYHLSASLIRKDLAQFGEFGIRGVGYDVATLRQHLHSVLGLETDHRLVIVGMGNLGSALACYLGFNTGSFRVVGGVDVDSSKIGESVAGWQIRSSTELAEVVEETGASMGVLAVPALVAQENYDALADAGVRGVINFAPYRLQSRPEVPVKDVDLLIDLEELAFFLR